MQLSRKFFLKALSKQAVEGSYSIPREFAVCEQEVTGHVMIL